MSNRASSLGMFCLVVVWIVWGSTYLGIRVAVREGSGFPPFAMAALRALVGGAILLLIGVLLKQRVKPGRRELCLLAASALLLWNGGNGLVTWSEHRVHSGYAALCVGSTPIFSAIVEAIWTRRRPSAMLLLSLLTGFAGLAVLTAPVLRMGIRADFLATFAIVIATLSWCLGSSLQQRHPVSLHPVVIAGWQQILALAGYALMSRATSEPLPHPTPHAWLAWAYLTGVGSLFGFTAYVVALKHLSLPVVMTYAYVNPLIAVALGWFFLSEPVTLWTAGGTALILAGVAGVFHDKFARPKTGSPPPAPEAA